MKNTKTITILCLLASVMIAPFAIAESATVLLKQGIYVEETEGDLDKAIEIYKQVLDKAAKVQRLASRATFQLGMCHLKKGEKETAAQYFQQLISKYPTQKTLVKKAQRELSKLPPTEEITSKSYVIHYKAIDQSKDALELLNQNYPNGVRTHHANRYRKNGKTIDSIRTDNETGKDKIVAAINDSDELELVKVDSPTANSMPIVTATSSNRLSLQDMIDSAEPSSTVIVPDGIYTEPIRINKDITLRGSSRDGCVFEVTADEPAIMIDTGGKGNVKIDNLTVKWQLATSDKNTEFPMAIAVKDAKAKITNCVFRPLGNAQRSPVAIRSSGFTTMDIDNCDFEGFDYVICFGQGTSGGVRNSYIADCGHQGIICYSGAKMKVEGNIITGSKYHAVRNTGGELRMANNLIIDNANRGVYLGNKSGRGQIFDNVIAGNGTGIGGFARSKYKIVNNVIMNNSYSGISMEKSCNFSIGDNIFMNNERGWIMFDRGQQGGNTSYQNTFWENKVDAENFAKTGNSITEEPQFRDEKNGDLTLTGGLAKEAGHGLKDPKKIWELYRKWQERKKGLKPAKTRLSTEYADRLKKKITLSTAKSPDGDRLTIQYAAIEICEAANVPYQWNKSQQMAGERAKRYIKSIDFENISADQALRSILKSVGLKYAINSEGLYLTTAGPATRTSVSKKDKLAAEDLATQGWKLWGQRKLTEAEEKFKEAIAKDPEAENAYQGLGWAQLNQGKKINAKDSFEKCVKLNPKNSAALNGLGWIAHGQGNIDEAIQWWQKAVTAQPGVTASLSGLTQVYMDRKEYDKAIKYYRMWLQVEPNNEQAKEGLKKAKSKLSTNLSTPEATIKSFVKAVYGGNFEAARKCISKDGHDYGEFKEMLAIESNHPFQAMIKAMDVSVPVKFTKKSIEDCKCKISWYLTLGKVYYFDNTKMKKGTHQKFSSYLERVDDKWLIRDI